MVKRFTDFPLLTAAQLTPNDIFVGAEVEGNTNFRITVTQLALLVGGGGGTLLAANNLSDLASIPAARTNLGLGTLATQNANSVVITGGSITGLASPSVDSEAATKGYVDSLTQVFKWKANVYAATIADGNLATDFVNGSIIDGVQVFTGNRILIKDQVTDTENGIYTVNASGPPTRATDADTSAEISAAIVLVSLGTVNANRIYATQPDRILGLSAITWTLLSAPVGTSGNTTPLLNTANTWSAIQTFVETIILGILKVRQSGGIADVDQLDLSHNGTIGIIECKDGDLHFRIPVVGNNYKFVSSGSRLDFLTIASSTFGVFSSAAYVRLNRSAGGIFAFTDGDAYNSPESGIDSPAATIMRLRGAAATDPAGISSPARTPAQITADQNNYDPGAGIFQCWSSDASRNVTGMVAGQHGETRFIWNEGAQNIVLQNENASSTAANRWLTSTGADLTWAANKMVIAQYRAGSINRWRVVLLP